MDCLLGNKLELAERRGVLLSRLHVALDGYQAIYGAQVWLSEIGAGLTVTVRKKKINGHKYMSEIKPWYRVSEIKNRTLALVKKLLGPNKNTMESIYHQTNFRVSKNHSCSNWLMDSLHRKLHQNSQNLGHENWIFVFMFYICITSLKLFK